jgi:MSHA biogenesis protein MshI
LFADAKLPLSVIDVPEMAQRNLSVRLEVEGRGLAMLSFDVHGGLLTVTYGGELYLSRRLDITSTDLGTQDVRERDASFERISLELQRSLDHFDRQHNYITTAKLVVSPLGEVATLLQQYLASNMYLPVEIMDLAQIVNLEKIPELKSAERQGAFLSIIGAALRQEASAT